MFHLRQLIHDLFLTTPEDGTTYDRMLETLDREIPQSVSVVGNASSLFDAEAGPLIDERPTIRFNAASIVSERSQGSRWDIVAASNKSTLAHYRTVAPSFKKLLFTASRDSQLQNLASIGISVPVIPYPLRMARELGRICGAKATTGMKVLHLLSVLGRSDVHIFGFDWKKTPTFYHTDPKADPHRHDHEKTIAKELIERHGWKLHTSNG